MKELTIVEQLIGLAETPEQIQYLTSNDQEVLKDKIAGLQDLITDQDRQYNQSSVRMNARANAFLEVIRDLADMNRESNCCCD